MLSDVAVERVIELFSDVWRCLLSPMAATKSGGGPSENVQVAVRCRPMSNGEKADDRRQCVFVDTAAATVEVQGGAGQRSKSFTFDHTFGPDSQQVRCVYCCCSCNDDGDGNKKKSHLLFSSSSFFSSSLSLSPAPSFLFVS